MLRISSDVDDWMGAKTKTPKHPRAKNWLQKYPMPNFLALQILKSIKWYNMKNINIRSQIPCFCLFIRPQEDLWLHLWRASRSHLNRKQNHGVSSVFVVHFINCILSRKFNFLSYYVLNKILVWFLSIQLLTCFSCSTFSHTASSHFDDYNYRIFPWIIEPGTIISFFAQKGGDFSREAIISNITHWKSCPKYFVLFSHEIKK